MSTAKAERNRRLLDDRARGLSHRRLARKYRLSRTRVQQVLRTVGDPLACELRDLAVAPQADLERERDRLQDRIRNDRRRLRMVLEELSSRDTDRILGLTG